MAIFATVNAQEETEIHQTMSMKKLSSAQCETIRTLTGLASTDCPTMSSSPSVPTSSRSSPAPEKRSLFRYIFSQTFRMNSILPAILSSSSSSSATPVPTPTPAPVAVEEVKIFAPSPLSLERVNVSDHLHPLSDVEPSTTPATITVIPEPEEESGIHAENDQDSIVSVSTSDAHTAHNANTVSSLAYYQLSLTLRVTRMLSWRKRSKNSDSTLARKETPPASPSAESSTDSTSSGDSTVVNEHAEISEQDELRELQKEFATEMQPQARTVQLVKSGDYVTSNLRSYLFGDEEEVFEYCPSSREGESKELMPHLTPLQRAIAQAREHGYHLHPRQTLSFSPIVPTGSSCMHSPPGLAHMHAKQKYILRSHQVSAAPFFRKEASHRAAVSTRNDNRHLLLGLTKHERSLREPLNGIIMPSMETTRLRIVYAPRKIPIRLYKYADDKDRGEQDWIEIEDRSCTGGLGVFKRDSQLRNAIDLKSPPPLPPMPHPPHRPGTPTPNGRELPLPPVPNQETKPTAATSVTPATPAVTAAPVADVPTPAPVTIVVTKPKEEKPKATPVAEKPAPAPKPAPPTVARKPVPTVSAPAPAEEKPRPLPTPTPAPSAVAPTAVAVVIPVPIKVNVATDGEKDVKPTQETSSKRPALTRKSAQTSLKADDSSQASSSSPIEKFRQWAEDRKRRSSRAAATAPIQSQSQTPPKLPPKPTISRPFNRAQQTGVSTSVSSSHSGSLPSMGKRQSNQAIGGRSRPPSTIINITVTEEKQVASPSVSAHNVLGTSTRAANNATKLNPVVQRAKDATSKAAAISAASISTDLKPSFDLSSRPISTSSYSSGKEAGDSDKENSKLVPTAGKRTSTKPQRPKLTTQTDRLVMPGLDPEVAENLRKSLLEKYYHSRPPSGMPQPKRRSTHPRVSIDPAHATSAANNRRSQSYVSSMDFTAGGEARHVENVVSNVEKSVTCSPPQSPTKDKENLGDISPTTGKPRRALDFFDEGVLPVSRSRALRAVKNQASLVL